MEIADVIAHTMQFRFLVFLSHKQVEELGAMLVVVQVYLVVQEVPEVCQEDQEEHQGHQRR